MLNEEDYSIIGFLDLMTALEGCVQEFKISNDKMTAAAVKSWDGIQLKAAEKKLQGWISELNEVVDSTYKKFHQARRARGLTNGQPDAE